MIHRVLVPKTLRLELYDLGYEETGAYLSRASDSHYFVELNNNTYASVSANVSEQWYEYILYDLSQLPACRLMASNMEAVKQICLSTVVQI